MKKYRITIALLLVAVMLFSLVGCGEKGPDVTGKYICVGESYGGEYGEPYAESWVELKKGGKGTYYSAYEFKMKWKLDGEAFSATVQFLGVEETMEGTLKDGVLEVKYGESLMLLLVKEGMEPPENLGISGADPVSDPAEGADLDNTGNDAGTGEKTGINEGVATASTLVGAFEGAGATFGSGAVSGGQGAGGGAPAGILVPEKIENPSTWYGYIYFSDYWGDEQEDVIRDAWAFVNTADKPYFEVFQDGDSEHPFLSMYMNIEENGSVVRPDIGHEDAWMFDIFLEPEDEGAYTFALFGDGSLATGVEYTAPDGSYGCYVTMFFRPDGSLWDESVDRLPPRYEEYKTELLKKNPELAGGAGATQPVASSGGDYGKSTADADGIVDFDTLQSAFDWSREQTSYENDYGENLTYEMLAEKMGVHGKAETGRTSWDEDTHIYRWKTEDNDFLLVTFSVQENGEEKWSGSSWGGGLK